MNTIHSVSNTSRMRSSEAVAVRKSFSFRTFMMRVMLVMGMMVGLENIMFGQVVSGTKYETHSANSLPTGWSGSGSGSGTTYMQLTSSSAYIQTSSFCQAGFSQIKVKARKYGGPSDAQALITVSWYDATTSAEKVLGTITPTSTSLSNYTISSPSNPTANTNGYIKIQCKGAGSGKGSGVSEVTITYTTGTCGSIIPTHTLTYSVNPVGAGTIVLSSTTVAEGSTATATATPNTGYAFDHWSISGTDASLSSTSENYTTVTMGTSNATVTAHFTEIPKYEITFNNGTGTLSTLTEEYGGAGIVLPSETAPYCNSPSYIFYGWAEEEVSNPSIVPTIVGMAGNRYFPSRNTTLYAVYATVSEYSKVTSSPDYEDKTGIYLIVCENDGVAFDGRKDPLDVSSNNVGVTISNNTIASNNTIDSISFYFFNIENNYTIRSSSGKFIGRDSDSNGLDSDASTEYSNAISFSSGNANIVSGGAYLRYNYTSGQNRFRYYKSTTYTGQRAIQLYKAVATYTSEPLCASATVIYDANGATGGDVPIDSNSPYPLVNGQRNIELLYNTGNLVKTGYTFDGWNTEFDGSGISYSEGTTFTLTDNIVLYAKWNPNVYSITWYSNGAAIDSLPIYHGNSLLDEGNDIADLDGYADVNACDGMHFVGWYESEFEEFDGTPTLLQYDDIARAIATGNKNYYAVFANVSETAVRWNLVTDEDNLVAGDSVIIVASDYACAMSKTQNGNNRGQTSITKSGSEISLNSDVCVFEIQNGLADGTLAFYDANYNEGNGGYLYAASSSNNYLRTEEELDINGNGNWTISIDEGTGVATITAQGSNSRNLLRYNNSNSIFSCYGSGQNDVSIYKKTGGTTYSNHTTFCPCNYGIDNILNGDMVWAGKNGPTNDWNLASNWVVYRSSDHEYHLAAEAPTSGNVFIKWVNDGDGCVITVKPNLTSDVTCNNLKLDGIGIDIAENKTLTINGTATFTSGIINGNVTFSSGATVSASTSSYVNGKVTKNGMSGAFTFPTGTASLYAPFEASSSTESNVSVQYAAGSEGMPDWWNHSGNLYDAGLNHASDRENWQISASATTTLSDIKLYWNAAADNYHSFEEDASALNSYLNVAVVKKNGFYWQNLGKASIDGSFFGAGSITAAEPLTITVGAKAAGDGEYFATFASSNSNVVLPIELISFTATCNGKSSLIEWTTATEKNNDYFVLERSHDAVNFKEIARIAGAGNSIEPISYAYTDYGVRNGDNYYRLVQVDYDGTSTASEIIVANCLGTDGEPEVLAYPNPFGDDLTLRFENFGNMQATVEVYDMLGRMVLTQKVNCSQNDYEVVLRLAGLSDGTYNVRISAKEFVLNRQVVKN